MNLFFLIDASIFPIIIDSLKFVFSIEFFSPDKD